MTIRFNCEDCHARIKVPDGNEGRQVRCPKCRHHQHVPGRVTVPPTEPDNPNHEANETPDLAALASVAGADRSDVPRSPASDDSIDVDPTPFHNKPDARNASDASNTTHSSEAPDTSEPEIEDDPLAALAAEAAGGGDSSATMIEQALHEVDQPDDHKQDEPVYDEDEADLVKTSPSNNDRQAKVTERSTRPARPSVPREDADETAPIRPLSPRPARQTPGPSTTKKTHNRTQAITVPKPHARSTPPQAMPLSKKKPATPKSYPNRSATVDLQAHPKRTRSKKAPPYVALQMVTWLLRILALMAIGGTVKLLLIAIDEGQTVVYRLLIILAGLIVTVAVWAVGEIAAAVRDIARSPH